MALNGLILVKKVKDQSIFVINTEIYVYLQKLLPEVTLKIILHCQKKFMRLSGYEADIQN